ncbi:MAG TPA: hypothetical protein VF702_02055 [Allosphingosinicella sp.]|jgi:hypothetical protein
MAGARLLLLAALALPACHAPVTSGEASFERTHFQRWLVPYLQAEYRDLPSQFSRAGVRYAYALVDLNDDGVNEALAYVASGVCGTGGCGVEVFARAGSGWRSVTATSIGYAPIQVLEERTHGWRDLGIYSRFNATEGHQARLRFNGTGYPINPSVFPAEPMEDASGHTVIVDARIPLFTR